MSVRESILMGMLHPGDGSRDAEAMVVTASPRSVILEFDDGTAFVCDAGELRAAISLSLREAA